MGTPREWLELANSAGGLIVMLTALYGAQQIRLLKRDMRDRAERVAKERAIEFASRYLTQFVSLHTKISEECLEKGVSLYAGPVTNFTLESLPKSEEVNMRQRLALKALLPALNELECIAAAFITRVASEQTAFPIIGRTFCNTVVAHYDVLAALRTSYPHLPYFSSIVSLFQLWSPRMERTELRGLCGTLERRISAIPSTVNPALGLDDDSAI